MGLVTLVLEAFERFFICNLEKIYSTISIRQICQRRLGTSDTGSLTTSTTIVTEEQERETEQRLLIMIASGELDAALSHHSLSSSSSLSSSEASASASPSSSIYLHFSPSPSRHSIVRPSRHSEVSTSVLGTPTPTNASSKIERYNQQQEEDEDEEEEEAASLQLLNDHCDRLMMLKSQIRSRDDMIRLSRDYIIWAQKANRRTREADALKNASASAVSGGGIGGNNNSSGNKISGSTNYENTLAAAMAAGAMMASGVSAPPHSHPGSGGVNVGDAFIDDQQAQEIYQAMGPAGIAALTMPDEDVMADF